LIQYSARQIAMPQSEGIFCARQSFDIRMHPKRIGRDLGEVAFERCCKLRLHPGQPLQRVFLYSISTSDYRSLR